VKDPRLAALRGEILAAQQAQAKEDERLRELVRQTVRGEILSVLEVVWDRVTDPYSEEATHIVEDVRSRLEARYGQDPGSTV
jgi:hypothetical protein